MRSITVALGPTPQPPATQFRHPEQLDRQRFHHELSDGGPLALNRPAEELLAVLIIVALLSLFAVAALASEGASLMPLVVIAGAGAFLLLLPGSTPVDRDRSGAIKARCPANADAPIHNAGQRGSECSGPTVADCD